MIVLLNKEVGRLARIHSHGLFGGKSGLIQQTAPIVAVTTSAAIGAVVLGGAVIVSNTIEDIQSRKARDPWEMFTQTFQGSVAGAVSGAFGGAAGFLLGSTAAGFGLLMMAHGASAMGEASIENAILGEKITVPMLLANAALGAFTFGWGDNIARAASKTWKKLVGEGAEKVAKEALEEGGEKATKEAAEEAGKGLPSGKNGAGGKPKSGAGNKSGPTRGKGAGNLKPQGLMDELAKSGVKATPHN